MPTPEKRNQLIEYLRESIQRLEAGEITRLPSGRELANQFGYNPQQAYSVLRREGIKLSQYIPPYRLPEPSADLAWFIGILSAGGSVELNRGRIKLENVHDDVLNNYALAGERLFSLNVHKRQDGTRYEFNSKKAARFLGDLRGEFWASTILSSHPWIVYNQKYTWGFINGYFEEKGKIYKGTSKNPKYFVRISTASQGGANLFIEMLTRVGIQHPYIEYDYRWDDPARSLAIHNVRDIRFFTQYVHSNIPEKESALEYCRTTLSLRSTSAPKYTEERLIEEWQKIKKEAGRIPTLYIIRKLREERRTEISEGTYGYRFGQGSFVKAREELERIIRERNLSNHD